MKRFEVKPTTSLVVTTLLAMTLIGWISYIVFYPMNPYIIAMTGIGALLFILELLDGFIGITNRPYGLTGIELIILTYVCVSFISLMALIHFSLAIVLGFPCVIMLSLVILFF